MSVDEQLIFDLTVGTMCFFFCVLIQTEAPYHPGPIWNLDPPAVGPSHLAIWHPLPCYGIVMEMLAHTWQPL